MDALQQAWNGKFGSRVKLPEWVFNFGAREQQQNVERKIVESETKVGKLREELDQELFLLSWLRKVRENGLSVGIAQGCEGNHVLSNTVETEHQEKEVLSSPSVPRESDITDKSLPVDRACGKGSRLLTGSNINSEDSPSSSEYHTAGQTSSSEVSLTNLVEEAASPSQHIRQRPIRKVSSKESLVAKEILQRVRLHRSCEVISEANKSEKSSSPPVGRHRRNSSAPIFHLEAPECSEIAKRRLPSDLAPSSDSDANASVGSGHIEQSLLSTTDTRDRVVLRDKIKRRPSLPMSCEEGMNQWKRTGRSSSERGNRSSNGVLDSNEDCNFMINKDDSDPAVINIIASRMRGALRTPRSSVSTDDTPQVANGGRGTDIVSPVEDPRHTPIPGVEAAGGVSAKHMAPLRKRSNTHDSPIKRERFSYHYSDDECLTPKIDSGDHSTFSNSPSSHRNSRSSNGIIDEELPYDLTLQKKKPDSQAPRIDRTNTITLESATASSTVGLSEDSDDRYLTSTLTPYIGYSTGDIFDDRSDSFSALEGLRLGDLDLDVELTLSKLRNKPEMSMATLLDVNENKRMNAQVSPKESSLEDLEYGESIEIDEATISAFTLSNDMYGSRSNSANSIPGLFTEHSGISPPEQDSPTHSAHQGVNLRQSGGAKRLNRKRMNLDLEMMTGGPSSDNDDMSRSSTSLTSEEGSTSPIVDENLVSACVRIW